MAIVHIRGFSGWGSWGPGKRCCGGQGKDSVEAAERYGVVGFGADIEEDTSVAWEGSMWVWGVGSSEGMGCETGVMWGCGRYIEDSVGRCDVL